MSLLDWLRAVLTDWAVGRRCTVCGQRQRGPRTMAAHWAVDHGDLVG